jgi:hypothetical protein
MCKFQLVWCDACEDYRYFDEVKYFVISQVSKWNKKCLNGIKGSKKDDIVTR